MSNSWLFPAGRRVPSGVVADPVQRGVPARADGPAGPAAGRGQAQVVRRPAAADKVLRLGRRQLAQRGTKAAAAP